jgi:ATP-dependent protease HslVU (ClpYQ) peptidase subunit
MTCIVGIQQDGDVYIGGDSAGVAGYSITVRSDQKVFRNGPFIMGFTSSFRMGQLLRYSFTPPKLPERPGDLDKYMSVDFINGVRECLVGGTFLGGIRGQLYLVDADFQIGKPTDGYDAIGCGEEFAKGSLFTSMGHEPKLRVREALKAASHHSAGVTGPYTILKTVNQWKK